MGGNRAGLPARPSLLCFCLPPLSPPLTLAARPAGRRSRARRRPTWGVSRKESVRKKVFLAELVVLPKCVFFFVQNRFLLLSPHRAQRLCLCLLTHAHTHRLPAFAPRRATRHAPRLLPCALKIFFCRLPSVATPRSHARPLNREQRSFAQSHCWRGERHAKTRQACEHTRTRASDRFLFLRCTPRADGVSHVQPPHAVVVHA